MTAEIWHDLVKRALLGTERDESSIVVEGALAESVRALDARDPEERLLGAASIVSMYQRAGRAPRKATASAPPMAPPEDLPTIGDRAARDGALFLSGGSSDEDLLPEWLDAVRDAHRVVQPRLLPQLLELGRRRPVMAEVIRAVIGHRGRWLAAANPEWFYAVSIDVANEDGIDQRWATATAPERVVLLGRLRESDPDAARARIESSWSSQGARDRAAYLESMMAGLSMADEPFLEAALDDRSKEVRRAAAKVLGHLSTSRLAHRMAERALACVAVRDGALDVTPPSEVDESMARDGILNRATADDGGQRAWWLAQILGATPPDVFARAFGMDAMALMAVTSKSDWRRTLQVGFLTSAVAYRDFDWLEALIRHRVEGDDALWILLPADRRERLFGQLLDGAKSRIDTHRVLFHLPKIPGPWAPPLSLAVAKAIGVLVATEQRLGEFPAYGVLRDAGKKLAPEAYPVLAKIDDAVPSTSYWKPALSHGVAKLERRAAMFAALKED